MTGLQVGRARWRRQLRWVRAPPVRVASGAVALRAPNVRRCAVAAFGGGVSPAVPLGVVREDPSVAA